MTTIDIQGNLRTKGFTCEQPKAAEASGVTLQSVQCLSTGEGFLYSVTYVSQDASHVRLITASITPGTSTSAQILNEAAGAFLSFIATLPYTAADATRAQQWVKANVATSGASMTIASAYFEIDPAQGSTTRRLNIVAAGAR
jgi:hypothetical protein